MIWNGLVSEFQWKYLNLFCNAAVASLPAIVYAISLLILNKHNEDMNTRDFLRQNKREFHIDNFKIKTLKFILLEMLFHKTLLKIIIFYFKEEFWIMYILKIYHREIMKLLRYSEPLCPSIHVRLYSNGSLSFLE